jgi:hypothetical protein
MVAIVCLLSVRSLACDVCGCSASGSSLGILPQYRKHFIGLSYLYQSFNTTHPQVSGGTNPGKSSDYFQSATVWGRFYPAGRLQIFAFVPYQYNYVKEGPTATIMNGLGDVKLLANYMLLNTGDSDRLVRQTLLAGGGIKAPTGRNNYKNSEGIVLSNMQPGTGSWDFIFNANYTIRYKTIGLNTDISYQLNTVNKRDYLYGNRLTAGVSAFLWQEVNSITLLPQVGFRYLNTATDLSNKTYQIKNPYSGGKQLYLSAGSGFYYKNLALTTLVNIPLAEDYANGLVESNTRYEMQIQYLF